MHFVEKPDEPGWKTVVDYRLAPPLLRYRLLAPQLKRRGFDG
jgi:hypothetical protein